MFKSARLVQPQVWPILNMRVNFVGVSISLLSSTVNVANSFLKKVTQPEYKQELEVLL